MQVQIKENTKHAGCYDLFINGNRKIEAESFQVCDNVRGCLVYGTMSADITECEEIALSII